LKATSGEKIFYIVNNILLGLWSLTAVLPLVHIIALSLSSSGAIMAGKVTLWPVEWSKDTYYLLFKGTRILDAFLNSVVITAVGVALNMVFTILAAYPLSKRYFYCRRQFTLMIVFTMLFGAGLIPGYLLVKSLGLVNSYWALWLPGLVSAYNMLVMKSFFENIPDELEDAARIDGCGEWRLVLQIILPLSMPVIAVLALFYGVGHWNSFMGVLIYINDIKKYNLALLIQQMMTQTDMLNQLQTIQPEDQVKIFPEAIKAAGMVVMLVPMLVAYPFLQKYFVKGVMIGAIKG